MYHRAVLLKESIELLGIKKDGTYIDATFGGGSHSAAVLERLDERGRVVAFDQDCDAEANLPADSRIMLIRANFRHIRNYLGLYRIESVDGVLADLGISSHQIDEASRGFSTRLDGPLDMRMDDSKELTAGVVINEYPSEKLIHILRVYGEIDNAARLTGEIVGHRSGKRISTTSEFIGMIRPAIPKGRENQYLAQVFQAIRIEVNDEMNALKDFLESMPSVLGPGGRLVVISYHSLEDRMVKNFFRSGNVEGKLTKDFYGNPQVPFSVITRKPVVPSDREISENNRARSAKLRAGERLP